MDQLISLYQNYEIVRWIVWIIIILVVWFLLSFFFSILRSIYLEYLPSIINTLTNIILKLKLFITHRFEIIKGIYIKFVSNHKFKYALDDHENYISNELRSIEGVGNKLVENINKTTERIDIICDDFRKSVDALKDINITGYNPDILDKYLLPEEKTSRKQAILGLTISTMFLICLIAYNTVMLNLFFQDLINLPPLIYSINLRVSHLLAFLFTILEIGLGYIFYVVGNRKSDERIGSNIIQTGVLIFALFLALIEGFFYSQMSYEAFSNVLAQQESIPFAFKQYIQYVLTPIGFILVFLLFIMGDLLISNIYALWGSSANKEINNKINHLKSSVSGISVNLDKYKSIYEEVKKFISNYNTEIKLERDGTSQLNEGLTLFLDTLKKLMNEIKLLKGNML